MTTTSGPDSFSWFLFAFGWYFRWVYFWCLFVFVDFGGAFRGCVVLFACFWGLLLFCGGFNRVRLFWGKLWEFLVGFFAGFFFFLMFPINQ